MNPPKKIPVSGNTGTGAITESAFAERSTDSAKTSTASLSPQTNALYRATFVSGLGQFHSNEPTAKKRKPYLAVTLADIRAMVDNPPSVPKENGRWFIPSTLASRTFDEQRDGGEFWMLWADLDKDPRPLSEVADAVFDDLVDMHDFEVYASRSSRADYQKGRVFIPLAAPLSGADWLLCQKVFNGKLEALGFTPDRKSEGCGQLCYLPNRGEFYEAHHMRGGALFDPLTAWRDEIEAARTQASERGKGLTKPRRLSDANDPFVDFLENHWTVYEITDDGRVDILCPFEPNHSPGSAKTSTSYYLAGVGGFAQGHFKCLHASCAGRTDMDFLTAIGYNAEGFDVIEVPAASAPQEGPLQTFYAYLPEHKYIHRPTRALWPMASVNGNLKGVSIGKDTPAAWLDKHRAIHQMTWAPGMQEVVVDRLMADGTWICLPGQNVYNLYRPPVVTPGNAQDVDPWRNHLRTIYPVEGEAAHIEKWMAHRVQFPGEKINHALVLGGTQGIGKDTLLEPVKRAVGAWNWSDITPPDMLGAFNPYVKSVVLRVNETHNLGDQTRFAFYERSKTLITAPPDVLNCNEKNTKQYAVVNIMGVVFTTNHKTNGIYLPIDDRRHFVAWSSRVKEDFTPEYWQTLWRWLNAEGCANVAQYLRTLDLSDFDAKAPPPRTEAFYAIVSANNNPRDVALSNTLVDDMASPDVLTLDDILEVIGIDAVDDNEVREFLLNRSTRRNIPHAMEQAGYGQLRNEGAKDGLWVVDGKRKAIYGRHGITFAELTKAAKVRIGMNSADFVKICKQAAAAIKAEQAEHAKNS